MNTPDSKTLTDRITGERYTYYMEEAYIIWVYENGKRSIKLSSRKEWTPEQLASVLEQLNTLPFKGE